jgi:hypothetical protein
MENLKTKLRQIGANASETRINFSFATILRNLLMFPHRSVNEDELLTTPFVS